MAHKQLPKAHTVSTTSELRNYSLKPENYGVFKVYPVLQRPFILIVHSRHKGLINELDSQLATQHTTRSLAHHT